MADWVTGKVTKVQFWTDALFSLTVHAPVHPFTAGQFAKLGLDVDGERVQRAYSYVNAPDNPDLEFYLVTVPDGKLSPRLAALKPGDDVQLVSEADFVRQLAGDAITDVGHIERALKAKADRTGRVSARIIDDMLAGIILIDTAGEAIGKCNGLTVLEVGDSAFGVPARISATVYPGGSGIVDIEREVNLGQPIHSKGVMILTGYLGSRYAQEFPLAISASIALEQSYGYVDGDSASLGEACTLISALSKTPLKQCFAITGLISILWVIYGYSITFDTTGMEEGVTNFNSFIAW